MTDIPTKTSPPRQTHTPELTNKIICINWNETISVVKENNIKRHSYELESNCQEKKMFCKLGRDQKPYYGNEIAQPNQWKNRCIDN